MQESTLEITFDTKKEFSQEEVEEAVKVLLLKLDPKAENIDIDFNQDEVDDVEEDSDDE